jgi:hypothetical protein
VRDIAKIKTAVRPSLRAAWVGLVAVVLLTAATLAATSTVSSGAAPGHRVFARQPAPTRHPERPGIAIATSKSFDLPDPFILDTGGKYYMYLSTAFNDNTQNVPLLVGSPGHWSKKPIDAVPQLPAWAVGDPLAQQLTWSPAVYKLGDLYVIYFSPEVRGPVPTMHCIAIGTSPDPSGPFYVSPTPFVCQSNLGGDIDPQLFVDPHGPDGPYQPNYLVWKSDNNSDPGHGVPAIWAQPISNDGLFLEGTPVRLFAPDRSWEMPLVEAPQMALSPNGSLWMFFSGGTGFFSDNYAMGAVHCTGPLGPCVDSRPGPLLASNAQGAGPGEETYFVGPDGSDWLLYSAEHTQDPYELYRPVEAARIGWNAHGPYVAEAGRFPRPSA